MADRKSRGKRRRRNGFVEIGNALLGLVVLGLLVAGGVLFYGAQRFYAEGPVKTPATFLVEKGNGLGTVASRLAEQGLIENSLMFRAGAWVMKKDATIIPGEYTIAAGSSMRDILTEITEGKPIEYFVNVRPGETSFEVAERLNDPAQKLTGEPLPVPPEGSILPVRHDYFPGDQRQALLAEMQKSMADAVAKEWAGCDPAVCGPDQVIKTPEQLITLASIIEKETGLDSERPLVAGLFVNRLKTGMRLQTDPTIIYGLTKGERALEGGITASQKAAATPYNTYVIDGLPPTPIANPGLESLRAAAHPAPTKHLYMMAVTPNKPADGHYFADTLAQHQANEAKYRRLEAQAAEDAPAATGAEPAPTQ